jgi:hypothetical protein
MRGSVTTPEMKSGVVGLNSGCYRVVPSTPGDVMMCIHS